MVDIINDPTQPKGAMAANLPAIDHRRRIRLWNRVDNKLECFADIRIEHDAKINATIEPLMSGRPQAIVTVDHRHGWRTRWSGNAYWHDGTLHVQSAHELLRYMTWPVNPPLG